MPHLIYIIINSGQNTIISTADYKYGAAKTQIDMIETLSNNYGITPIVLTKKHNPLNELCESKGIENYSYWYRDIMSGSAYSNPVLNVAKHSVKYIMYCYILDYYAYIEK